MWGMGLLGMLLWGVGLVLVIVLAVRWAQGRSFVGPNESALDILKKRYARGEITKEEFERMKRDIE